MGKWRSFGLLNGPDAAQRRAVFKAMGFDDIDLTRPLIGIANTWSELCPGHYHLRELAKAVKAGVWQAGGMPVEFNSVSQCATITIGLGGIRYDTPTRDIVAAGVEIASELHMLDGLVMLSTCDKNVPAHLLAAARVNIPTIIVTGGSMLPGQYKGEEFLLPDLDEMVWGSSKVAKHSAADVMEAENYACPGPGACPVLGTANTMQCLAEAIGLALPGSAIIPAVFPEKLWSAKASGRMIVELVKNQITPRQIMTRKALENTICVHQALGGSTNAVLHILALAEELGLGDEITLDTIERFSFSTPCITNVRPNGPYDIVELDRAGGIPGVMKVLAQNGLLHLDIMTVTGKTVRENLTKVKVKNREVIHSVDDPVYKEGGVTVLRGNLASSAITRVTGIRSDLRYFTGPARVFDSFEDALKAIWQDKIIKTGDVVVVRYEGPRGGPGMTEVLPVLASLVGMGLDAAVVTDGKFSGFARGPGICQVTPEAAVGGPLALVEDGDLIEIDITRKQLNLKVPDEELLRRRAKWQPPEPRVKHGVLNLYARLALPATKGAGLPPRLDR